MDIGGNLYILQSPHVSCGKPSAYVCMGLIGEEVQGSSSNKKQREDGRITELQRAWVLCSVYHPLHLLLDSLCALASGRVSFQAAILSSFSLVMRLLLCNALQKLKPSLVHKADNTPIFSELLRSSCPIPQGAGFLMYISSDLHIVPSMEPICCHLSRTGRQKAVYQNMSTVICRTCHYHSQFWGVSHENTRLLSFLRL